MLDRRAANGLGFWSLVRAPKNGGKPETLARDLANAARLLVDDEQVFVGSATSLIAVPKAGGTPSEIFAGEHVGVVGVNKTHVFLLSGVAGFGAQSLFAISKSTKKAELVTVGGVQPASALLEGSTLYEIAFPGKLRQVTLPGGTATTLTEDVRGSLHMVKFASNSRYIYGYAPSNHLFRIRRTDGVVDKLDGVNAIAIAADEEHLYWVDNVGGTLSVTQ